MFTKDASFQELQAQKKLKISQLELNKQQLIETHKNLGPYIQELSNLSPVVVESLSEKERERLRFVRFFSDKRYDPYRLDLNSDQKIIDSHLSKLDLNGKGLPKIIVKCQELQIEKKSEILKLKVAQQQLMKIHKNLDPYIQKLSNLSPVVVESLSEEESERLMFVRDFVEKVFINFDSFDNMKQKEIDSYLSKLDLNEKGIPKIIVKCQELQDQNQSQMHQFNKPSQKITEQTVTKPKETVKPIYVQPKPEVTRQETKRAVNDKEIVSHSNNVTSNVPKTHLSHMTGDAQKHKQRCLDALHKYKAEREKEASRPLNFFRNAFGKFDSDTKINCVDKMIAMLETDTGIHFEKSDRAVMQDGRLGKIFKEYEKSIFTLDNFKVEERINNLRNDLCGVQPKCDTDLEYNYILKAAGFIKEKAGGNRQKERELIVDFAVKYTPADLKDEAEFRKQYLPEIINVANKTNATPVAIQNNMPQQVSSKDVGVPQADIKVKQADIKVKEAAVFKEARFRLAPGSALPDYGARP